MQKAIQLQDDPNFNPTYSHEVKATDEGKGITKVYYTCRATGWTGVFVSRK